MEQFTVELPVAVSVSEVEESESKSGSLTGRLIVAVSVASMFSLSMGSLAGYASPALPNLNENRNPFRVTDDQQSWVASLLCLGAAAGGLASGSACDLLGRKLTMMTSSLLVVVGFTVVAAASDVAALYVGMALTAFFAQIGMTAALLYGAEVSPTEIRGTCMSLMTSAYSIGMVVAYAMGIALSWNWLAVFVAALAAAPTLVLVLLPESPRWFLLRGNREAAVHGIKWFRDGVCDLDEVLAVEHSLRESSNAERKCDLSAWTALLTDRRNRKSLFVCTVLFIFQGFSGNIALQMFTVSIFEYAGAAHIDPNVQSIISGVSLVAGSLLCPLLIERIGRKRLLAASCVLVCASMASAAAFFLVLETRPDYAHGRIYWLPVVGLSLSNFGFMIGLFPLPYILSIEIFPTAVRGTSQTVLMVVQGLANFACIKTFLPIALAIGASGVFFVYAGVCAAATLFVVVLVNDVQPSLMR